MIGEHEKKYIENVKTTRLLSSLKCRYSVCADQRIVNNVVTVQKMDGIRDTCFTLETSHESDYIILEQVHGSVVVRTMSNEHHDCVGSRTSAVEFQTRDEVLIQLQLYIKNKSIR